MRKIVSALLFAVDFAPLVLHAAGNDWPSRDGDPGGQPYSTLNGSPTGTTIVAFALPNRASASTR